jgi:cytochrome c oxidase cbb3-type subunit 3
LNGSDEERPDDRPSSAGFWVALGMMVLVAGGFVTYAALRRAGPPAPAAVAADPVLALGRQVYMARCVSCHGERGHGDGPIASDLKGPPVGDLTDGRWKHGERPEEIRAVVERGVKDTAMSGWKGMISDRQLGAVVAYVEYLAGRRRPVAAPAAPHEDAS